MNLDTLVTQARQDDRASAKSAFTEAKRGGVADVALEMFIATHGPIDVATFEQNDLVKRDLFGEPTEDGIPGMAVFATVQDLIDHLKLLLENNAIIMYGTDTGQLLDIPARVGMLANEKKPVPPPSQARHMGGDGAETRIEGPLATGAAIGLAVGLGWLGLKWWQSR